MLFGPATNPRRHKASGLCSGLYQTNRFILAIDNVVSASRTIEVA